MPGQVNKQSNSEFVKFITPVNCVLPPIQERLSSAAKLDFVL